MNAPHTISGVPDELTTLVFDGDQTLWDFQSALDRALAETRHEIARVTGLTLDRITTVAQMLDAPGRAVQDPSGASVHTIGKSTFRDVLTDLGVPTPEEHIEHVHQFFIGRRYEMCRPYRDTVPALRALGGSYRLVLFTNEHSYPERLGLGSLFSHTFVGTEMGLLKPSPAAYEHIAAACGAETLVSIGNSIGNDIVGPASCGWRTVWINRDNLPLPNSATPDAILTSLDGLEAALVRILA
ncbi:unannotated protein [freshwater metagenome]|uniref:Unannotated protein n=1 Tax=freshwater metagenome TaxID=449393 RepID=A0A6J7EYJ5_9ZZZZ|nr:HAD-IA family hydrolase [Actinomycetota bacterium]